MESLLVILLYIAVVFFDFVPLVNQHRKNEIWTYSVILAVTLTVLLLHASNIQIPSPSDFICKAVESIFHVE